MKAALVKATGVFALIGAVLGAAVGVISHFVARTVPHTFYLGVDGGLDGGRAYTSFTTPLVHPPWWPTLVVAIGVGLVLGAAVGLGWIRLGLRIVRATPAAPADE